MLLRDTLVKEKSMKLMIKSISPLLCVFTLFVVGCAKVEAPTPTDVMPSQDITPDLFTPTAKPTPHSRNPPALPSLRPRQRLTKHTASRARLLK